MKSLVYIFALAGFMLISNLLATYLGNVLSGYETRPPKHHFIELLVKALFYFFMVISFPFFILTKGIMQPQIDDAVSEARSKLIAQNEFNEKHAYQVGYDEGYSSGCERGAVDALSNHFISAVNEVVLQKNEDMPVFYARRTAALRETATNNHFSVCDTNVTYRQFIERLATEPDVSDLSKQFALSIWEETFRFIHHEYYDDHQDEEISLADPLEVLYVWSALYYTLLDLMVEKGISDSVQSYFPNGLKQLLPDVPIWFINKLVQEQTIYLHMLNASGIVPHATKGADSLFRLTANFALGENSQSDYFSRDLMYAAMRLNAACAVPPSNQQETMQHRKDRCL